MYYVLVIHAFPIKLFFYFLKNLNFVWNQELLVEEEWGMSSIKMWTKIQDDFWNPFIIHSLTII
jgi:hypothetical protein